MTYKLKKGQEAFEMVDGPDAGKKFLPGREYDSVPASEKSRFEKVKAPAGQAAKEAPAPAPAKTKPKPKDKEA